MKLKTHTSIVVSTLLLLTVIACSEAPSSKAEKKEIYHREEKVRL